MPSLGFMPCFIHRVADIEKLFLFGSLFVLFCIGPLAAVGEAAPPRPVFQKLDPGDDNSDVRFVEAHPYLTLSWEIPQEAAPQNAVLFELQRADSADFLETRTLYRGPDRASFISGLAEGDYFFRVRAFEEDGDTSAWSEPLYLTIQYDSLAKAFLLFGIGAVVSISTVVLVVAGDRRTRREAADSQ